MSNKKKVLIVGWSPCTHTSYGTIIRHVATRLAKDHHVVCLATNVDKSKWTYKEEDMPFVIYAPDYYLNHDDHRDGLDTYCRVVGREFDTPDVVILIDDSYNMTRWADTPQRSSFKLVMYSPIDGYPYPQKYLEVLSKADATVAYTAHAAKYLKSRGVNNVISIIPAGVDIDVYKPPTDDRRNELQSELDPNTLNMLFIGNNQPRKLNWQLIELVGRLTHGNYYMCNQCGYILQYQHLRYSESKSLDSYFMEKPIISKCPYCISKGYDTQGSISEGHKVPVKLWMHTHPGVNLSANGSISSWDLKGYTNFFDVEPYIAQTELTPEGQFYVEPEKLADLIIAHDVVLQITGGEGFGMPALESTLCGTPVVYTDYSAHTHFLRGLGFPVKVAHFEHSIFNEIRRGATDMFDAIKLLSRLQKDKSSIDKARTKILSRVPELQKTYSWETVGQQWSLLVNDVHRLKQQKTENVAWC